MCDNNTQRLQENQFEDFDEKEDCILPDTIFGEILLIFYMIKDLLQSHNKSAKIRDLKRQICIYIRWLQSK